MKLMRHLFFVMISAAFLMSVAYAGQDVNILEYFDEKQVTNIYINDIINSTGNENIDLAAFKMNIEDAFLERVNQQFEIAQSPEEADVVMDIEITEYLFTEEDPVDNLIGIGGVAMDAAKQENYARMIAVFKLTDTKTSDVLWQDTLKATITDDEMVEPDSYDLINDRIVKVLMRNLFSRQKNQ
ncbi:MAG: hypothetical protein JW800_07125 [Candidatus Omnitrophica bacterium]|nr:hypothetical protein [Candidatus Omnitrophota bacterium]